MMVTETDRDAAAAGENHVLRLEGVHKSFRHNGGRIEVLKGIDLDVVEKDCIALLGASGVGKSTLLNIMGALEAPTRGAVLFRSRDVSRLDWKHVCELRNREIGFVFQFHHLLPEFDAVENTMMPALIARINRKKARDMAAEILGRVGIGHRLKHRVGELSGGEQQRVAIARALILKPGLLLADEPTGNLDRKTGDEIVDLLLKLNREDGLTAVIATHNLKMAERMSKQMEIIDGRIH
jgi:lipoprotein-releasing system ATP-binding protein